MPIFEPRNRVQIVRQMVARVIARSRLVGLARNSVIFHVIAGAGQEDAEQYFQMARLKALFAIDDATGSDLDGRAGEIQPGTVTRRLSLFATGGVVLTRNTIVGALAIPVGTQVAASDAQGRIQYRTTAAATILAGNTDSALIPVVAAIPGIRGNVVDGQINQLVTKIPTLITVNNPGALTTGRDRETDEAFRRRIKDFVASLSRGTLRAIEGFARNVALVTGEVVLFARVVGPIVPTGRIDLYIDDGTGTVETFDDTFVGAIPEEDVLIASAAGGEFEAFTSQNPVRDDVELKVRLNDVAIVRGVDFEINTATGQIEMKVGAFPAGLAAADKLAVNYRHFTGLIAETQKTITGDPLNPITFPGVEAGGILTVVQAALKIAQTLVANLSVQPGFDVAATRTNISFVLQEYVNNLDIGDDVIVSEIVERAMGVRGVFDFQIVSLSGASPPVNQTILNTQVARLQGTDISIT